MFLVCVGVLARAAASAAAPDFVQFCDGWCCSTPVRPNAQILSTASPQEDGQRTLIKRPPCISRMMGKSSSMARFSFSFLCARVHVFMHICVMRFLRWCCR